MATPTYDLLDSTTLGTATASVTFSAIDQSYGDLIVVVDAANTTAAQTMRMKFNGDTVSTRSYVRMYGDGSSAVSTTASDASIGITDTSFGLNVIQIMDYSATDKYKTSLSRANSSGLTLAYASTWQTTSTVTSIELEVNAAFAVGSTFQLFGVAK